MFPRSSSYTSQEAEAEDAMLKLENLKKSEKDRVKRIKALQAEIAKITSELKSPVETESMEDINDELVGGSTILMHLSNFLLSMQRQLNLEHRDTINRQGELQERQKANIDQISMHKVEIAARLDELVEQLNTCQHVKSSIVGSRVSTTPTFGNCRNWRSGTGIAMTLFCG